MDDDVKKVLAVVAVLFLLSLMARNCREISTIHTQKTSGPVSSTSNPVVTPEGNPSGGELPTLKTPSQKEIQDGIADLKQKEISLQKRLAVRDEKTAAVSAVIRGEVSVEALQVKSQQAGKKEKMPLVEMMEGVKSHRYFVR